MATALLCAIAVAASHAHAETQPTRQVSIVQDMAPLGLAPGQALRYTWAGVVDAEPGMRGFEPARIAVRVLAPDGSVVAQDGAVAVGAGRLQSFVFGRSEMSRSGEAGTGRLQLRLEVTIVGPVPDPGGVVGRATGQGILDAVEIVDESTGGTTATLGRGSNEISLDDTPGREPALPDGDRNATSDEEHLVGVAPDQSLRISAVNPLAPADDGRNDHPSGFHPGWSK